MLKASLPCGTNTSRIPPVTFVVVQLVEKVQVVAPAGTAQLVVVRVPVGTRGTLSGVGVVGVGVVAEVIKTGLLSRRVFVRVSKSCTV